MSRDGRGGAGRGAGARLEPEVRSADRRRPAPAAPGPCTAESPWPAPRERGRDLGASREEAGNKWFGARTGVPRHQRVSVGFSFSSCPRGCGVLACLLRLQLDGDCSQRQKRTTVFTQRETGEMGLQGAKGSLPIVRSQGKGPEQRP